MAFDWCVVLGAFTPQFADSHVAAVGVQWQVAQNRGEELWSVEDLLGGRCRFRGSLCVHVILLSCRKRLESNGILNESPRLRTLAYDPRVAV